MSDGRFNLNPVPFDPPPPKWADWPKRQGPLPNPLTMEHLERMIEVLREAGYGEAP